MSSTDEGTFEQLPSAPSAELALIDTALLRPSVVAPVVEVVNVIVQVSARDENVAVPVVIEISEAASPRDLG